MQPNIGQRTCLQQAVELASHNPGSADHPVKRAFIHHNYEQWSTRSVEAPLPVHSPDHVRFNFLGCLGMSSTEQGPGVLLCLQESQDRTNRVCAQAS